MPTGFRPCFGLTDFLALDQPAIHFPAFFTSSLPLPLPPQPVDCLVCACLLLLTSSELFSTRRVFDQTSVLGRVLGRDHAAGAIQYTLRSTYG
jgi:hypothetical protein